MTMEGQPVWINVLVFAVSAATIWWAGTRLERYADLISQWTRLGQAFTGMLLLAVATSLPEVATTITAVVVLNNPTLAVHNLLGGVAMQTALIAVADIAKTKRGALTFFSPDFVLLIEAVGLLILLQIVIAGVTAGGVPAVFSLSSWSVLILFAYVGLMYSVYRYRTQQRWAPSRMDGIPDDVREELERARGEESSRTEPEDGRTARAAGVALRGDQLARSRRRLVRGADGGCARRADGARRPASAGTRQRPCLSIPVQWPCCT